MDENCNDECGGCYERASKGAQYRFGLAESFSNGAITKGKRDNGAQSAEENSKN